MTTNLNGLVLDVAAPAPTPRGALPLLSSAGVNDMAAIARQQLPSAVPAPALISAYAANIASPPKPPVRAATTPSSALAAQLIAQMPGISEQELAIFTPQQPTPPPAAEEEAPDFLNAMRVARGDAAATPKENQQVKPAQQPSAPPAPPSFAAESAMHASSLVTSGLPTVLSQWVKRQNLIQARGVGAYQLAEARMVGNRRSAPPPAPESAPPITPEALLHPAT